MGGKATNTEKVSLAMTSSAAVSTTPEVLGNLMGDETMASGGQLALTNGSTTPTSSTTSGGAPSLSQLVGIMNSTTGAAPKATPKGKAKAKARSNVRPEHPKTPDELRQDYRKLVQTSIIFNGFSDDLYLYLFQSVRKSPGSSADIPWCPIRQRA